MIVLCMNRKDYENDIRALLMAFFYGERIVLELEDEPDSAGILDSAGISGTAGRSETRGTLDSVRTDGWSHRMTVRYGEDRVFGELTDRSGRRQSGTAVCHFSDYKEARNEIKIMIYSILSAYTEQQLPWGTLTGIRPTKLPMELFEQGVTDEAAVAWLQSKYLVSEEKARLCAQVARNEEAVLKGIDYGQSYSLYVGIPFCPSICAYCSFSSYPLAVWKNKVDDYLDALEKEIRAAAPLMGDKKLLTFYMGGGTPTSLSAAQMDRLLSCLEQHFDLAKARERTVEAGRPDSITEDKLAVLLKHGIERISINPQTMNQETLDLIGRRHSVADVERAFHLARAMGFQNINMDLIAGLPGETAVHMQRTMDAVVALGPDSVTVHSLALKRAAFLNQNREQFPVAGTAEVNRMIGISHEGAAAMGARPYYLYRQKNIAGNLENVGYARAGCEGLYNILIMEEKQSILALGAGAASKRVYPGGRIERCENVKDVASFIARTDEMIERKRKFLMDF